jgi:signal transduction histidine kinase
MESSNLKYSTKNLEVENSIQEINSKSFIVYSIIMTVFSCVSIIIDFCLNGMNLILIVKIAYNTVDIFLLVVFVCKFSREFIFFTLSSFLHNIFFLIMICMDKEISLSKYEFVRLLVDYLFFLNFSIVLRYNRHFIFLLITFFMNIISLSMFFTIFYLRTKQVSIFYCELILSLKFIIYMSYYTFTKSTFIQRLVSTNNELVNQNLRLKLMLNEIKSPLFCLNLRNLDFIHNSSFKFFFRLEDKLNTDEFVTLFSKNSNEERIYFNREDVTSIITFINKYFKLEDHEENTEIIKYFLIFKGFNLTKLNNNNIKFFNDCKGKSLLNLITSIIDNDITVLNNYEAGQFVYENDENLNFNLSLTVNEIGNDKIVYFKFNFNEGKKLNNYQENNSKSMIFAKLAHEFKTPLLTMSSLIKEKVLKSQKYGSSSLVINDKILEDIINLSNYMISMINDINDFSKFEQGYDFECVFEEFNLHETIRFIFSVLQTLIFCNDLKKNSVTPELEISSTVPEKIYSDEKRLKQVLLNLISNSFKFTTQGNIKIIVDYQLSSNEIYFRIEDTGIGIKKEDQDKIFSTFFMVKNEETAEYNKLGSGLGLNICRKIVNQLGNNDLLFESSPYVLTKFWFTINDMKKNLSNLLLSDIQCSKIEMKERSAQKELDYIDTSSLLNSKIFKDSLKEEKNCNSNPSRKYSFKALLPISSEDKSKSKSRFSDDRKYLEKNESMNKDAKSTPSDILNLNKHSPKEEHNQNIIFVDNFDNSSYYSKKSKFILSALEKRLCTSKFDFCIKSEKESFTRLYKTERLNKIFSGGNNYSVLKPILKYLSFLEQNKRDMILIVDDQKYIRKSTKNILRNYVKENNKTYSLICANDGFDFLYLIFLDQYLGKNIKFVISDDSMNFVDGSISYNFIKNLQNCDTRYFKFMLLTSYEDENSLEKYKFFNIVTIKKPLEKKMVPNLLQFN